MAYEGVNAAARICLAKRELTKAAQVLNGICAGIAADNHINDQEIHFLKTWLLDNDEIASVWPGYILADRVRSILADGIITEDERQDFVSTLKELSGNRFTDTGAAQADSPALPCDELPSIFFRNMTFCFTGGFLYGTRSDRERIVSSLGGKPLKQVTKKLHYLIIGTFIEPSWANTTYGRKIETAVLHRDSGSGLCIASEYYWTLALKNVANEASAF